MKWLCVVFWAVLCVQPAFADTSPLLLAYQRARAVDAAFLGAEAEREANRLQATVARSALFPEFRATMQQMETETTKRTTYTLTQPLLSADRFATFMEAEPRKEVAELTYRLREYDLLNRLFKAVTELVKVREGLRLNKAKIDAFSQQQASARKSFELGVGTITDLRDTEVRLAQAQANDLTLRARFDAAVRQYEAIVGELPEESAFELSQEKRLVPLASVNEYLDYAQSSQPQVQLLKQQLEIAELTETKAKAFFLPQVNAVAMQTITASGKQEYSGFQISMPLQAGGPLQALGARANTNKLREQLRDAETKMKLEVYRLHALVQAGVTEIETRIAAIRAAELSVEANEKSFKGGVRSKIDVLNSLQTLFQTNEDHVNAQVALGENYMNLLAQAGYPPLDVLQRVQKLLFPRPAATKQNQLVSAPKKSPATGAQFLKMDMVLQGVRGLN